MSAPWNQFSRRERQIMDVLYARGSATGPEIHKALPDPPSYSSVRALLRILVEKGHVHFTRQGSRYLYAPRVATARVRGLALKHAVDTFFQGSVNAAVAALVDATRDRLTESDLNELTRLLEQARREKTQHAD